MPLQVLVMVGEGIPVVPLVAVLPPLLPFDLVGVLQLLQGSLHGPGADLYLEFLRQLVP